MKYTTYYNLKKPESGDPVSIDKLNDNADSIDAQLHSMRTDIDGAATSMATISDAVTKNEADIGTVNAELDKKAPDVTQAGLVLTSGGNGTNIWQSLVISVYSTNIGTANKINATKYNEITAALNAGKVVSLVAAYDTTDSTTAIKYTAKTTAAGAPCIVGPGASAVNRLIFTTTFSGTAYEIYVDMTATAGEYAVYRKKINTSVNTVYQLSGSKVTNAVYDAIKAQADAGIIPFIQKADTIDSVSTQRVYTLTSNGAYEIYNTDLQDNITGSGMLFASLSSGRAYYIALDSAASGSGHDILTCYKDF